VQQILLKICLIDIYISGQDFRFTELGNAIKPIVPINTTLLNSLTCPKPADSSIKNMLWY